MVEQMHDEWQSKNEYSNLIKGTKGDYDSSAM